MPESHPGSAEQTPLISNRAAENMESGLAVAVVRAASSPATATATSFNKDHLQNVGASRSNPNKVFPNRIGQRNRGKSIGEPIDSGDVLAVTSKQTKTRQRKNVGAFRRKKQDYATWKGRVGVHVEFDEFDLKKLLNVIYQTLPTDWELVDCYDVIR